MAFRRMLVGLDLEHRDRNSELECPTLSRVLFDRAVALAVAQDAQLRVCSVVDGLDLTRIPASPQQVALFGNVLEQRLESLAEEAREAGVECETSLVGGVAAQELLREQDEWQPELLIVGASGQATRWGRTALEVARSARCPVLVERIAESVRKGGWNPSEVSAMPNITSNLDCSKKVPDPSSATDDNDALSVLLADDLSDSFGTVLLEFVASGCWRDAKCWLTHVVEPERWPEAWQLGLNDEALAARHTSRLEAARLKLHEHLVPTDHRTMTYGILPQVESGCWPETLERLVRNSPIDLLVCGSSWQAVSLASTLPCSSLLWNRVV